MDKRAYVLVLLMDRLIMVKSLPPLAWFRAFEAAARCLSFTAAAKEIGMTQSAVSQHVKSLEVSLGTALFIRGARGITLTDDGRKLLPQVDSALDTLLSAARAFDRVPTRNILTIATSVSVAQWIISPLLPAFTKANPDVKLRLLSTIWPDDFQTVNADIEIPFGSQKQVGQNAIQLEPNGLVAVKSADLKGSFQQMPLIESVGTSDGWSTWGDVVGGNPKPSMFVDTYGAALTLAAHGNGVALVSEFLARPALLDRRLVRAHDAIIPSNEGYFLRVKDDNPTAKMFGDWFLEASRVS